MGKVKRFGKGEGFMSIRIKTSPKVSFPKGERKKPTPATNPALDEIFKLKTTKVV